MGKMNGYNSGIWHAVHKFGQSPLCRSRRAVMVCEIASFRDGRAQCKRCAKRLAEMDERAAKKATGERTLIRTIDLTPTWQGVLPLLLAGVIDGTPEGQRVAREELTRMAALADEYVAAQRSRAA